MALNIVFGSVKTSGARTAIQEFTTPVMKLEAYQGAGTTRRILFNRSACEIMNLEDGAIQELLFGFVQPGEGSDVPRLFVINTEEFTNEVQQVTYKTSTNKSKFKATSERGKGVSSSKLYIEIAEFMGLEKDTEVDLNFDLSVYDNSGEAVVYELVQRGSGIVPVAQQVENAIAEVESNDAISPAATATEPQTTDDTAQGVVQAQVAENNGFDEFLDPSEVAAAQAAQADSDFEEVAEDTTFNIGRGAN